MPTMEHADLARYLTVAQTAVICAVQDRRVRNWQALGLLVPATKKGLLQYRREDVIRCAVLLQLQSIFGQDSALAVELASALDAEQLDGLLDMEQPVITVHAVARTFRVQLDPAQLAIIRERLAAVPR